MINAIFFRRKIKNIKLFITDCDGCLTDGGMYYSEFGDELKKFNTRDGMGIKLLNDIGIITGIITGESRELNKRRVEKLKIKEYHFGIDDKLGVVNHLCDIYGIRKSQIVYIGDDINDLEAIRDIKRSGGFTVCPKDAHKTIKRNVNYVGKKKGGEGIVREIADLIVKVK